LLQVVTGSSSSMAGESGAISDVFQITEYVSCSPLRFYGTNAYWLHMVSDEDLDTTLHDIAAADFTVVRTWAFNDVTHKPASGTYFQVSISSVSHEALTDFRCQVVSKGSATINDGPDGLQRLDKIVQTAEKYGLKLIFTLTNNWNPERTESDTAFRRRSNDGLPRGYLSNDYGGSSNQ
jgi:mannan endo-1,4-beta-mannosidase